MLSFCAMISLLTYSKTSWLVLDYKLIENLTTNLWELGRVMKGMMGFHYGLQ